MKLLDKNDLVFRIYYRFSKRHYWSGYPEKEDLLQIGKLALLGCQERYDKKRGEFEPFASKRIYGAMLDEFRRKDIIRPCRSTGSVYFQSEMPNLEYNHRFPADLSIDISSLSERKQKIINLIFFRGLSEPTIANRLKLSAARVSQLKKEALAQLRLINS